MVLVAWTPVVVVLAEAAAGGIRGTHLQKNIDTHINDILLQFITRLDQICARAPSSVIEITSKHILDAKHNKSLPPELPERTHYELIVEYARRWYSVQWSGAIRIYQHECDSTHEVV